MATLGLVAFLGVAAGLHVIDRRDARFHLVSEYALERPLALGLGFAALATSGLALGAALWRAVPTLAGRAAAVVFVLFAVAAALLGIHATDHEGTAPATTPGGRIHDAAAGLTLLTLLVGHLLAWSALAPRRVPALILAIAVAAVVPRLLAPAWIGVHQRALIGALVVGLLPLVHALRTRVAKAPERLN